MLTPITAVGAAGAAVTLTVPAGSDFHAISSIEIILYNTAARTGSATPVTVTTTGLNGLAFTFPSAGAVGTVERRLLEFSAPVKSTAKTAVTAIVCPATTSVIWRVNVFYDHTR